MTTAIHSVNLGVADLAKAIRFYQRAFGFVTMGGGSIEDEDLKQLWRMEQELKGEYVWMAPPEYGTGKSVTLRLMKWSRPGVRIWQSYQYPRDRGLFALSFRLAAPAEGWQRLMEAGAFDHERTRGDHKASRAALGCDPNGVMLGLSGTEDHDSADAILGAVEIHVGHLDRAKAFYACLGFSSHQPEEEETVSEGFSGNPDMERIHLHQQGNQNTAGCLELVRYPGRLGRSLRGRAVPPNYGLVSMTYLCPSIEKILSQLRQAIDFVPTWQSGPYDLELMPWGKVRKISLLGPDDEMIELVEIL